MEHRRGELAYRDVLDKRVCPGCGAEQSYDEVRDQRRFVIVGIAFRRFSETSSPDWHQCLLCHVTTFRGLKAKTSHWSVAHADRWFLVFDH